MTFEELFAALGRMLDHMLEYFLDLLAQLPDNKLIELCLRLKMTPKQAEEFIKWLRERDIGKNLNC